MKKISRSYADTEPDVLLLWKITTNGDGFKICRSEYMLQKLEEFAKSCQFCINVIIN